MGRYLAETVAAVPHFTKADFEKMMADQSNDCTLVSAAGWLANQPAVAESPTSLQQGHGRP